MVVENGDHGEGTTIRFKSSNYKMQVHGRTLVLKTFYFRKEFASPLFN